MLSVSQRWLNSNDSHHLQRPPSCFVVAPAPPAESAATGRRLLAAGRTSATAGSSQGPGENKY